MTRTDQVSLFTGRAAVSGGLPIVFGHRGYSSLAPENTLAAFGLLLDYGIPGVELDVHRCASGELVVCHDDTLARVAGVDLDIISAPLEEIRAHEVGSWFDPRFHGERIPLLTEVIDLLGTNVVYDVEIKYYKRDVVQEGPQSVERQVVELLYRHGVADRALLSSFDPRIVRACRRIDRAIPAAVIYADHQAVPWFLRRGQGRVIAGANVVKPHHELVSERLVQRHHNRNRGVIAWTVDSGQDALRVARCGVDGIVSNDPSVVLQALSRR